MVALDVEATWSQLVPPLERTNWGHSEPVDFDFGENDKQMAMHEHGNKAAI